MLGRQILLYLSLFEIQLILGEKIILAFLGKFAIIKIRILIFFAQKMLNQDQLLEKYADIIKEEVNVKEI